MFISSFKTNNINTKKNVSFSGRKIENAMVAKDALNAKILPEKTYVVADIFHKKDVDIDGDGVKDLSHGEFICRLIKNLNPNAKTMPFYFKKLNDYKYETNRYYGLSRFLNKIKPDAVNHSMGISISFNDTSEEIDKESIFNCRKILKNSFHHLSMENLAIVTLERITKDGFKLFNSSGNNGNNCFDVETLVDGINAVGSTDSQKNILNYSTDIKSLKFAQGRYGVSEIKDKEGKVLGYDIVGNGKVAIKAEEVSSKGNYVNPLIKEYVGKPLEECLIPDEEFEFLEGFLHLNVISNLEQGKNLMAEEPSRYKKLVNEANSILNKYLFSIDQVEKLGILNIEKLEELKETGKIINLSDINICFDVDKHNKIIYDPDRSGRKNVVNLISGTSFASPTRMVIEDILEANQNGKVSSKKSYQNFKIIQYVGEVLKDRLMPQENINILKAYFSKTNDNDEKGEEKLAKVVYSPYQKFITIEDLKSLESLDIKKEKLKELEEQGEYVPIEWKRDSYLDDKGVSREHYSLKIPEYAYNVDKNGIVVFDFDRLGCKTD